MRIGRIELVLGHVNTSACQKLACEWIDADNAVHSTVDFNVLANVEVVKVVEFVFVRCGLGNAVALEQHA